MEGRSIHAVSDYQEGAMKTTWRKEIEAEMREHLDSWGGSACTLTEEGLDREFECNYVGRNGLPFTLWTPSRVYFPVIDAGAERCGSVSRHPDGKPTEHQ